MCIRDRFLAFVHADAYGRGLGIDATSAAFGPLTCNPGVIRVVDGYIAVSYTHLDVYKRQLVRGVGVGIDMFDCVLPTRTCLLYTSRCV